MREVVPNLASSVTDIAPTLLGHPHRACLRLFLYYTTCLVQQCRCPLVSHNESPGPRNRRRTNPNVVTASARPRLRTAPPISENLFVINGLHRKGERERESFSLKGERVREVVPEAGEATPSMRRSDGRKRVDTMTDGRWRAIAMSSRMSSCPPSLKLLRLRVAATGGASVATRNPHSWHRRPAPHPLVGGDGSPRARDASSNRGGVRRAPGRRRQPGRWVGWPQYATHAAARRHGGAATLPAALRRS